MCVKPSCPVCDENILNPCMFLSPQLPLLTEASNLIAKRLCISLFFSFPGCWDPRAGLVRVKIVHHECPPLSSSSSSGIRPLLGIAFLSPFISRWSFSTLDLCLGLGLALSIVTCVVLISPLHGVGFMVSVMFLSEKNFPIL